MTVQSPKRPVANKASYEWRSCGSLTRIAPWEKVDEEHSSHVRKVGWADSSPDKMARYQITAHGVNRLLRPPTAWMYELAQLDYTDTEIHTFSKYFIAREGIYKALHYSLATMDGKINIEESEDAVKESFLFALDHDLAAPTIEDTIEVCTTLRSALMDGVNIMSPSGQA